MEDIYLWLKTLHILSSTVLFGTGLGTAFHLWMAHRTGDKHAIAIVARDVVIADFLFTTPAVILQPVTGILLLWASGIDPLTSWLVVAYALYLVAGACWLPVVWLQIGVRDTARTAVETHAPLSNAYHRKMRLWFALGWPAFIAVIAIFWLMVTKPDLW